MKILLIGNYPNDRQISMLLFTRALYRGLKAKGHDVRVLQPRTIAGRLCPSPSGLGKWLGYMDKFLLFPHVLKRMAPWADLVHFCDKVKAPLIDHAVYKPHLVSCHDVLSIQAALEATSPNKVSPTGRLYQKRILRGLNKASYVVCGSETARYDLLRVSDRPEERTSVIPYGLFHAYRPMRHDEIKRHMQTLSVDAGSPFLMHVGGAWWYKNQEGALEIFRRLIGFPGYSGYRLIVIGPWSDASRRIMRHPDLEGRVRRLGFVDNEQLRALYSAASALVFPSLDEGFGLPIIEAQACGCPVFTSDKLPMTEAGGDAAGYFDPKDPERAARIIMNGLKNTEEMKRKGFMNVQRFSTETMIDRYETLYKTILASSIQNRASKGR